MKYATAKKLVLDFFCCARQAQAFVGSDEFQLTISLAANGEVELRLTVVLQYERKRNHTRLSFSTHLYASRLVTYPDEPSLFQPMPGAMRQKVLALRTRLSGQVPYSIPCCPQVPPEVLAPQRVDEWTDDSLLSYLLLASTLSVELATFALPAQTAEELLAWAREQDTTAAFPALRHQSSHWSVVPRSTGLSPATSAA